MMLTSQRIHFSCFAATLLVWSTNVSAQLPNLFGSDCDDGWTKNSLGICQPNANIDPSRLPNVVDILPPEIKKEVEKLGGAGLQTVVQHFGGNTLATIAHPSKTIEVLAQASGDTITAIADKNGLVTTVKKAVGDVAAAYEKGWRDTSKQAKRSFDDTVEAGKATGRYIERQAKDLGKIIDDNARRLQEGKPVDAMWGLAVEPMQAAERNFAQATQESKVIAQAAQSAAATYGGPAGAAAYSAWSTYRSTGDANLALRAGVISALSSQTGKVDTSLPTDGVLRKAALAGAAGGIAVAAAGGDEAAVTEAFLKSGGTVLVQAGSAEKSTTGPKLSEVAQTAQCISARDVDCFSKVTYLREKGKIVYDSTGLPKIDPKKFDPKEHLPKWSQIDPKSDEGKKHVFMSKISKLKDMEAIPLLKNEWILTWTFGRDGGLKSEKPAVVLTYIGKQQPFISNVSYGTSEAITNAQKSARTVPKTMVSADVLAKAIRVRKGSTVISTVSVNGVERDTFNFTAWLDLPAERSSAIESVNYYFDAETFINPKPGIHGGKKFEARWIGWGCAAQARVVATLIDGQKIIGRYNMCNVAGMGSSALADAEQKPVTTKEKENLPSSFLDSLFGDQKVNEPKK